MALNALYHIIAVEMIVEWRSIEMNHQTRPLAIKTVNDGTPIPPNVYFPYTLTIVVCAKSHLDRRPMVILLLSQSVFGPALLRQRGICLLRRAWSSQEMCGK